AAATVPSSEGLEESEQGASTSQEGEEAPEGAGRVTWDEVRTRIITGDAKQEFEKAARLLAAVTVHAVQSGIAASLGIEPLKIATVERVVNDRLKIDYYTDSLVLLSSLRSVLRGVEEELLRCNSGVMPGFKISIPDKFADEVLRKITVGCVLAHQAAREDGDGDVERRCGDYIKDVYETTCTESREWSRDNAESLKVPPQGQEPSGDSDKGAEAQPTVHVYYTVPRVFAGDAHRPRIISFPAAATVTRATREIRERYMTSFEGIGQFIVVIAALIAAIFAICACMEPAIVGEHGALILGCLAVVVLLPMLGVGIHKVLNADNAEERDQAAESVVLRRLVEGERRAASRHGAASVLKFVACTFFVLDILVFGGAVVACAYTSGTGASPLVAGALLLVALLLAVTLMVVVAVGDMRTPGDCGSDVGISFRVVEGSPHRCGESGAEETGACGEKENCQREESQPSTFVVDPVPGACDTEESHLGGTVPVMVRLCA
ncbi:hypothetical protein OC188_04185, partial [Anaplasma capra]|nr:hypothetical protein [Anaplasma capra]